MLQGCSRWLCRLARGHTKATPAARMLGTSWKRCHTPHQCIGCCWSLNTCFTRSPASSTDNDRCPDIDSLCTLSRQKSWGAHQKQQTGAIMAALPGVSALHYSSSTTDFGSTLRLQACRSESFSLDQQSSGSVGDCAPVSALLQVRAGVYSSPKPSRFNLSLCVSLIKVRST